MNMVRQKRRDLLKWLAAVGALGQLPGIHAAAAAVDAVASIPGESQNPDLNRPFRLWANACSHVGGDLHPKNRSGGKRVGEDIRPRESLATAIRQSEGFNNDGAPSFEWDIAVHLGDFSGNQGAPADDEGAEVVRQFGSLRKHRREDFYSLAGNHDATFVNEPAQWWFRKWIDPLGENTGFSGVDPERRPYKVEGTWERYSFRVGNILFLMMSDRNHIGPPVGRGDHGGYPAGAVSLETFQWWKHMVETNQDSIIVSAHHHVLRNTTVASGPWEGLGVQSEQQYLDKSQRSLTDTPAGSKRRSHPEQKGYHGYYSDGGPEGTSYLYFVGDKPNAGAFENYLEKHPGAIDIWLGAHTHTDPDDTFGGKSHIEQKWGVTFINVAALTEYHSRTRTTMSRLLEFKPNSNQVSARCYLHNDQFAPRGWHAPAQREFFITKPFHWS